MIGSEGLTGRMVRLNGSEDMKARGLQSLRGAACTGEQINGCACHLQHDKRAGDVVVKGQTSLGAKLAA